VSVGSPPWLCHSRAFFQQLTKYPAVTPTSCRKPAPFARIVIADRYGMIDHAQGGVGLDMSRLGRIVLVNDTRQRKSSSIMLVCIGNII
jgi:hypothetical protein